VVFLLPEDGGKENFETLCILNRHWIAVVSCPVLASSRRGITMCRFEPRCRWFSLFEWPPVPSAFTGKERLIAILLIALLAAWSELWRTAVPRHQLTIIWHASSSAKYFLIGKQHLQICVRLLYFVCQTFVGRKHSDVWFHNLCIKVWSHPHCFSMIRNDTREWI
jgi:hypothetical protein